MSEDERALRARLAALEAEVQAEAQAKAEVATRESQARAARADAARAARAEAEARVDAVEAPDADALEDLRTARPPRRSKARTRDQADHVADALALARRASDVKEELTRPRGEREKSWMVSAGLSFFLGPVGWLYAGSVREAAPAALAYLLLGGLAVNIIPMILLMPVFAVLMPLSAIAGVVYALTYNRHGERQRLFNKDDDKSQSPRRALPPTDD